MFAFDLCFCFFLFFFCLNIHGSIVIILYNICICYLVLACLLYLYSVLIFCSAWAVFTILTELILELFIVLVCGSSFCGSSVVSSWFIRLSLCLRRPPNRSGKMACPASSVHQWTRWGQCGSRRCLFQFCSAFEEWSQQILKVTHSKI